MLNHLFENRNTTVTNLLKLGDCLGRSLRENIELFSIDSEEKRVAYLSETGKVISGDYSITEDLSLENIQVQEASIFTDNEVFDDFVTDKVSNFVGDLNSNNYGDADNNFSEILSLWENRLKFESVKKRLEEKSTLFSESYNIVNTEQFQRFLEIMPQVTDFLKEEKETIQKVREIENAIKLSNSVSKAFNFPRLSSDKLEEDKSYTVSKGLNKSIYELICKQELVKKELLESKKNFEDVWATNPRIRQLAGLIFEDSDERVLENLVEAVIEVPFLALTTKKQLLESISNAFSLTDDSAISTKELKSYVSRLFEMKKPLKQVIISILNEKYGINVQNLKDSATFNSLANTQVVIFEALTRLAPKGSVVKETLSELSKVLKTKNGVEVIDVNDVLQECFEACEYDNFCQDFSLVEEISFETILDEEVSATELLEKVKEKLLLDKKKKKKKKKKDEEDPFKPNAEDDNLSPEQAQGKAGAEKDEKHPASDCDLEDDSVRAAEKKTPKAKEMKEGAEEAAEAPPEGSPEEAPEGSSEESPAPLTKDEFLDGLKDMEELLKGMSAEEEEDSVDTAETDETEA